MFWKFVFNGLMCVLLTLLTQVGGLAWLGALAFRRRLMAFGALYAAATLCAVLAAPFFGREALDCFSSGPLRVQSKVYCALNRHYVAPELHQSMRDMAQDLDAKYPGTQTLVLDASFPFLDGFPLLPHLSHDDGEKVDLAFFYKDETGYLPGAARSPIGYFAFEQGHTQCAAAFPTLRWNMGWLQPLFPDKAIEPMRMRAALQWLGADPRIGKVLIEPHLLESLAVSHSKFRFQGCRAARHDDHIHVQL